MLSISKIIIQCCRTLPKMTQIWMEIKHQLTCTSFQLHALIPLFRLFWRCVNNLKLLRKERKDGIGTSRKKVVVCLIRFCHLNSFITIHNYNYWNQAIIQLKDLVRYFYSLNVIKRNTTWYELRRKGIPTAPWINLYCRTKTSFSAPVERQWHPTKILKVLPKPIQILWLLLKRCTRRKNHTHVTLRS